MALVLCSGSICPWSVGVQATRSSFHSKKSSCLPLARKGSAHVVSRHGQADSCDEERVQTLELLGVWKVVDRTTS